MFRRKSTQLNPDRQFGNNNNNNNNSSSTSLSSPSATQTDTSSTETTNTLQQQHQQHQEPTPLPRSNRFGIGTLGHGPRADIDSHPTRHSHPPRYRRLRRWSPHPTSLSHTPATWNPLAGESSETWRTAGSKVSRRSQSTLLHNNNRNKAGAYRGQLPSPAFTHLTKGITSKMQMVKCNDARVRITTTINSVAVDWSELLSQFPPDAEFTVVLRFGYNLVLDNTACGTQQTQGHITWHFLPANIPLTVGITARSSIRSRSNGETREVAKENESVEGSSSTLYSNSFPTRTKQHFPCAQGRSQWGVMVLTPEHELGPWVFASTRKWLLAWQPDFAAASRPRDSEYNKQQRQFLDNLYRWALFTLPQGHEDGDDDDDEEEEEFKIEFGETVSFAALPAVTVTSDTSACVSSTVLAAPDGRKLERLVALANPTMRYCIDLTAGDVDWGKSKRLRRYRSNFRLSMNHDYRASVAHLIEYHKTSGNGVWFVPELFELFCAMVDDGPASVVHPIAFELWEGEVLVAVTAGYAIGRAFHDYSMATFVRDKRGCGAILTQVVGETLKQAGYELWYWGFKGAYMSAYDKMGGKELSGEEFGERWSKLIVDESDGLSSWERCLRIRELVYDGHAMVLPKASDADVVAGVVPVAAEDVAMSTTTSGSALVDM